MNSETDKGDSARCLVEKIVEDLFTNGFGQKAERLVLTSVDGRDLGGWCRGAMRDRILDGLNAEAGRIADQGEEV